MNQRQNVAHNEVVVELVSTGLLQPQPKRMSFRAWSMLIPSIMQAIGLVCFGLVGWSLTEFNSLSNSFRVWLVIAGSLSIAIGGNVGTLPVTVEIFRKWSHGTASWPDWIGFGFSTAASLVETYIALSFLAGFEIMNSQWRVLLLACLGVADSAFGLAELGIYLASHDERLQQWREEYKEAVSNYYSLPQPQQEYEEPTGEYAETPVMPNSDVPDPITPESKRTLNDWRNYYYTLNLGEVSTDDVESWCNGNGPKRRTLYNWRDEANEWLSSQNGHRIEMLDNHGKTVEEISQILGYQEAVVQSVLGNS